MFQGEQESSNNGYYYSGGDLPFSVEQTTDLLENHCCHGDMILAANGLSDVVMNSVLNVTESTQIDLVAGVFNCIPLPTEQLTDVLDVKNYNSSVERSGLTFFRPEESSTMRGPDNYYLSHWTPIEESISSGIYMSMERQHRESAAFQVQALNTNYTHEFQSTLKGEADTSDVSSKSFRSMSRNTRERSRETEYRRRSDVNQRVQALQELLPKTSKMVQGKRNIQEDTVEDAISHIKYLQLQLKELSRSRLGGESSSGALSFVEGYGHYHSYGEMCEEPLEDILGNLFEENPAAVSKLLQSKGLHMLPMVSDASLCNQG